MADLSQDGTEEEKPLSLAERWGTDEFTEMSLSQCAFCVHKWSGSARCDAFAGRDIPYEILVNEVVHNRPLPELGQKNQVVFERRYDLTPDSTMEES
jgi:hypothetical protein